jgi:hypothetical protein
VPVVKEKGQPVVVHKDVVLNVVSLPSSYQLATDGKYKILKGLRPIFIKRGEEKYIKTDGKWYSCCSDAADNSSRGFRRGDGTSGCLGRFEECQKNSKVECFKCGLTATVNLLCTTLWNVIF